MADENNDMTPEDDFWDCLLYLSLPDNDQTWLYCLPESNPNIVKDINEFLSISSLPNIKSCNKYKENQSRNNAINTRTFTRQRKLNSHGNVKKQIIHPNKSINPESSYISEKSTIINNSNVSSHMLESLETLKPDNEDSTKPERYNTNVHFNQGITVTTKTNNCLETKSNNSWNISNIERTLLFDVSCPLGGIEDCKPSSCTSSESRPLSHQSCISFLPESVSTPNNKLDYKAKKKSDFNYTPKELDLNVSSLNYTFHSLHNNTYSVLLPNSEIIDQNSNLNVTQTISVPNPELENPANVSEEMEYKRILEKTFIFDTSIEANVENDLLPLHITSLSIKDNVNNKSDEHVNFPYNTLIDLNSTITIKSKDNDSEQDSCYSSSSNLRSLGDVCVMSQLQSEKTSNRNMDLLLKKSRSEDLLCSAQNMCKLQPDKEHVSSLNLAFIKSNQLEANLDLSLKKSRSEDLLCSAQNMIRNVDPDKPHESSTNLALLKSNQLTAQNMNRKVQHNKQHGSSSNLAHVKSNQLTAENTNRKEQADKQHGLSLNMPLLKSNQLTAQKMNRKVQPDKLHGSSSNLELLKNNQLTAQNMNLKVQLDKQHGSSSNLALLKSNQLTGNSDLSRKKSRSEDLLFSAQNINLKVQPDKQHVSSLNLALLKRNQLTGEACALEPANSPAFLGSSTVLPQSSLVFPGPSLSGKHLQKPNYFVKNHEKPGIHRSTDLLDNVPKNLNVKAPAPNRFSKIPRPQSRIPKLNLK